MSAPGHTQADPSLVGQPHPTAGGGLSTGTASAQQPADLPASAKVQMDAVAQDPQATLQAGQDVLKEVGGGWW